MKCKALSVMAYNIGLTPETWAMPRFIYLRSDRELSTFTH